MAPHSLGACGPLISIIRHCTTSTIQHFHALSAFPRLSRLQIKHTFKALQLENPIFLIKSRLENQVIDAVSFLQSNHHISSALSQLTVGDSTQATITAIRNEHIEHELSKGHGKKYTAQPETSGAKDKLITEKSRAPATTKQSAES